jgi:hypothetical protein
MSLESTTGSRLVMCLFDDLELCIFEFIIPYNKNPSYKNNHYNWFNQTSIKSLLLNNYLRFNDNIH